MSKESIISELPEDFVRMMRNWAMAGSCGAGMAISPAYDGVLIDNSRYESHIPVLGGWADDVDVALAKVANREQQAVKLFWQYEGNSLSWLGRRLGGISYHTAEARVRTGHGLLREQLRLDVQAVVRYRSVAEVVNGMRLTSVDF